MSKSYLILSNLLHEVSEFGVLVQEMHLSSETHELQDMTCLKITYAT